MPSPPKKPRRTAERILEVTLELFNRFREPNVSTTLISAEMNISPGNLYYHYPAKDELVNSLFDRYGRALNELLQAADGVRDVEDAWLFFHRRGAVRPGLDSRASMGGAMFESVRKVLAREAPGGEVAVRGWLRTARHSKGVSFLDVSDGSCFGGVQVVVDPALANYESELRHLRTGCAVIARGELVVSPAEGQRYEIHARTVEVVGVVGDDYPLQKKRHSFEFLREIAHLRTRTNSIGAVLRVRNAAARAIHDFFQERGFLYLHTPIITASDCEGAGSMVRVTTLASRRPLCL